MIAEKLVDVGAVILKRLQFLASFGKSLCIEDFLEIFARGHS